MDRSPVSNGHSPESSNDEIKKHCSQECSYRAFRSNDGADLVYQSYGVPGPACVILIHGFSGSSDYFVRNFDELSKSLWVVAPDLRGHGQSARTAHGHHVSRLAADLRDLLLELKGIVPCLKPMGVGCSIGAAILWTYIELYTEADFDRFIFVDQAPLQNYAIDGSWLLGNYGCHDAASLAWNQANMILSPSTAWKGLVSSCLGYRFDADYGRRLNMTRDCAEADALFFTTISELCDPRWLAKLMADHTAYDHRDTMRQGITKPCLVLYGKRSGCFPVEGMIETARLLNQKRAGICGTLEFESGHWLFYEESNKFNGIVRQFPYLCPNKSNAEVDSMKSLYSSMQL